MHVENPRKLTVWLFRVPVENPVKAGGWDKRLDSIFRITTRNSSVQPLGNSRAVPYRKMPHRQSGFQLNFFRAK